MIHWTSVCWEDVYELQTFLEASGFSTKVLTLTFLLTSTDFGILCAAGEWMWCSVTSKLSEQATLSWIRSMPRTIPGALQASTSLVFLVTMGHGAALHPVTTGCYRGQLLGRDWLAENEKGWNIGVSSLQIWLLYSLSAAPLPLGSKVEKNLTSKLSLEPWVNWIVFFSSSHGFYG